MASWCFVHAADLHLDTPFAGLGRVDPAVAERLRAASLAAFDNLIDLTLDRGAAFLVLAGDVYDGIDRGPRAQLALLDAARRLDRAGVQLLIVHGNHDPLSSYDAIGSWPENVTVFEAGDPQYVTVAVDGQDVAVVGGVSFATKREPENLAARFQRRPGVELPHIGVLHANVGANPAHAAYAPASIADLAATGIDYWALGHIHTRQNIATWDEDGFWAVYPGNLQGRSPKPAERGAKGAVVVDVLDGQPQAPQFVPLDLVRFASADVQIDDATTLPALEAQLADRAAASVEQDADGRTLVLRAQLDGNGPLYATLQREDTGEELIGRLQDRADSAGLDVVWTRVKDQTGPPRDARDVAGALDVLGAATLDEQVVASIVAEAARRRHDEDDPLDLDAIRVEAVALARQLLEETRA